MNPETFNQASGLLVIMFITGMVALIYARLCRTVKRQAETIAEFVKQESKSYQEKCDLEDRLANQLIATQDKMLAASEARKKGWETRRRKAREAKGYVEKTWPCQQLHGGVPPFIYQGCSDDGTCSHPECNPVNDDRANEPRSDSK